MRTMHLEVVIGYLSRRQNRVDNHCQAQALYPESGFPLLRQHHARHHAALGSRLNMSYSGMLLVIHVLREACIQGQACPDQLGVPKWIWCSGLMDLHRHGDIGSGVIGFDP